MHFGHKSRVITLLFLNEIIPLTIPYHSSPIPMSMQSLKKIGQKGTNVRARKRSADGQTDGRANIRGLGASLSMIMRFIPLRI